MNANYAPPVSQPYKMVYPSMQRIKVGEFAQFNCLQELNGSLWLLNDKSLPGNTETWLQSIDDQVYHILRIEKAGFHNHGAYICDSYSKVGRVDSGER